jgi:hypothetical protein
VGELAALMGRAGFQSVEITPVQAGQWARRPPLDERDEKAKELLAFARKAE